MRYQGKITKWNDGKGFGFISRNDNNQQIFVHISAFENAQQQRRPTVGEVVSFEVADDIKKGLQAYNVIYLNRQSSVLMPNKSARKPAVSNTVVRLGTVVKIFGVLLIGAVLYKNMDVLNARTTHKAYESITPETSESIRTNKVAGRESNQIFTCSGKTNCSEMSSCDEAMYYLKHCPGTIADGDHDGIPCEDQWCGH